jgi:dual specificity tyrosine-phosphorylation-regulated kinase 2/3/4
VFYEENDRPKILPNTRGKERIPNSKNLQKMLNCGDEYFVDFVDKCIEWDTNDRLTPETALKHPWIRIGLNEMKAIAEATARGETIKSPE